MSGQIQITLRRSLSKTTDIQKANMRGLGLRKREQTVIREDSEAVRGMIRKVLHLVDISRPTQTANAKKKGVAVSFKAPAEMKAAEGKSTKKKATKKKVASKKVKKEK